MRLLIIDVRVCDANNACWTGWLACSRPSG